MLGARYICAILLALASFSVSSAQLNMNNVCALVNDGLKIASITACDAYYMCSGGVATLKNCSAGNYFDIKNQMCRPQQQVKCLAPSSTPCLGYSVGSWAPVANSCSGFYYCGVNAAQRSTCPNGQNFNPSLQSCVWATLYPCSQSTDIVNVNGDASSGNSSQGSITVTVQINLCNLIPNGIFFGSPSNCSGWNKCVNNVLTSGVCPGSYQYNPSTLACDLAGSVTCSQVTNDPNLTPNYCSVIYQTKAATSCSSYYVCDGTNFQLTQCPAGLYYDTVSTQCVSRLNARNDCDRCEGVTDTFVNMYSTQNCTGYLYCQKGHEAASGFCPIGTYFDERNGACLATTEPNFGCCNPSFYNTSAAAPAAPSAAAPSTPSATAPSAAAPSAAAPSAAAPSAAAPSAAAPSATAPSTAAPSATAPSATAPSAAAPSATAPSAAAPSAAAPSATAPSAAAPSATS